MMRRARRYIDVKRDSEDGKEQALSCRCLFLFVLICRSRWGTKNPEEAVITLSVINAYTLLHPVLIRQADEQAAPCRLKRSCVIMVPRSSDKRRGDTND